MASWKCCRLANYINMIYMNIYDKYIIIMCSYITIYKMAIQMKYRQIILLLSSIQKTSNHLIPLTFVRLPV